MIYDAGVGETDSVINYFSYDEQSHKMQSVEAIVLRNTSVVNMFEYQSKQIAIATDKSELLIFEGEKVINKFQCPTSKQCSTASVVALPGFELKWFPFLAWNVNNKVYIAHLNH